MQLDLLGNQKSGGAERAIHASGGGIILRSNMPEGEGIYSGGGGFTLGGRGFTPGGGFTSGGGGGFTPGGGAFPPLQFNPVSA